MRRFILIFLIVLGGSSFAGQYPYDLKGKIKLNPRKHYPNGVNLVVLGPIGMGGITYDYFIVPKFAVEGGLGIQPDFQHLGFTVGGRYHFFGNTPLRLTPYLGVYTAFGAYEGNNFQNYSVYIPVGLNRIKKNLSVSLEVGYRQLVGVKGGFYGSLKIGPRWKVFKKK